MWYGTKGIGRVEESGDRPSVVFWADRKSGKSERFQPNLLTPLTGYFPEAESQRKAGGDEAWKRFESGIKKAPLRLVALALSSCGNAGEPADIKEKLDKRVPIGPWGSWWKRTEPKLSNLPQHFGIAENGQATEYKLRSSVADVPPDWIEPKVTPAEWKKWLNAKTSEPPPGRFPTKPVANALAKWPAKDIEHALNRLIINALVLSADGGLSAQVAEGWLAAVATAAIRRRGIGGPDPRGYDAARVGEVLARLSRIAGERAPHELLLQAGVLDGAVDSWRRGFLAGLWESFEGENAREVYVNSSAILGRQARGDLSREMFLSAFGPDFSERRHSQLDRLLDAVPEAQRTQLLIEVIATAQPDQRDGVLDYLAGSRHASGPENLELRMVAALTLASEQSEFTIRTSRELADAIAPRVALEAKLSFPAKRGRAEVQKRPADAVLGDAIEAMREEIARKDREIAELTKAHAAELEDERRARDRFQLQARDLGAEVDSLQDKLRNALQGSALNTSD